MEKFGLRLRRGAFRGLEVFLWYAAAEYVLLALSLVVRPHRVMMIEQWRGTVVLFVCYALLGAFTGAVIALFLRKPDPHGFRVRKLTTLTVVLLFGVNSATGALLPAHKVALAGAALFLAIAVIFDIGRGHRDSDMGTPPALIFGVLICSGGALYSSRIGDLSPALRVVTIIGCVVAAFVAAVLAKRLIAWCAAQYAWVGSLGHAARFAAILLLVFGPSILSPYAEGRQPGWPAPDSPAAASPNVVLVVLDTVSAGHMGIYGYERANTPRLNDFLKQSTLYTHFVAAAPLTLTSHASIFTGLYPQSHGAYMDFNRFANGRPLAVNIPTLAQILNTAGYRTMAVAANKVYLCDDFGTLRGFQFVDWLAPTTLVASERDYLLRNRLRTLLRIDRVARDLDSSTMTAEEVSQRAFSLLDQSRQQRSPFFLFLNYMDAHTPYVPPPPYNSLYPGRDLAFDLVRYWSEAGAVINETRPIDPRARQHLISQYDGAIAYLDATMGELIAHLKQNGQFDRTLIIITADHGEAFGERNILGHNSSVYEDQVHVPLIVKYPGQTQADRVDSLASHVDLMPTILDFAGLKPPDGIQGMDLRQAAAARDRVVVAEMHGSAGSSLPRFQQIEWALYSGSYKMIYSTKGMRELYDLSVDPAELHNLFQAADPRTAELRARLVEWSRATTPRFLDPVLANGEVEHRLQSLGYAHQGVD